MNIKENWVLKELVNKNFTWGDVNSKYEVITNSSTFCPFHEHTYEEPNAKFYHNLDKDIYTLHCFVEHKNYTVYDYVREVLCKKYENYKSPQEFLMSNLGKDIVRQQAEVIRKNTRLDDETFFQKKVEYINNTFFEANEDLEDYIERLYTGC